MDIKIKKLIKTIGSLYDAAIDPDHWQSFMRQTAQIVDGGTGVLVLNPNGTPGHYLKSSGEGTYNGPNLDIVAKYIEFPPQLLDHYMANFFLEGDVWRDACFRHRINNRAWIGSELISSEDLKASRFYKEVFNANGDEYIVGAMLDVSPVGCSSFSVSRGIKQGDFGSEEKKIFELIVPHMQRARTIYSHCEQLRIQDSILKEILNTSLAAIALIDLHGKLIYANNSAENILRENDGISYRGELLVLEDSKLHSQFLKLTGQCIKTSNGEALSAGGGLLVPRPSEKPLYRIVVSPVNLRSDHLQFDPLAAAVIFIYDTTHLNVPSAKVLKSVYELTNQEIKVCHLFYQCYDLKKIADHLELKISTVRTHFYKIFEKTDTRSQPELMKLIDQLPRETD